MLGGKSVDSEVAGLFQGNGAIHKRQLIPVDRVRMRESYRKAMGEAEKSRTVTSVKSLAARAHALYCESLPPESHPNAKTFHNFGTVSNGAGSDPEIWAFVQAFPYIQKRKRDWT